MGLLALKRFQQAKIPVIVNMAAGAPLGEQFAPPRVPDSYVFRLAASDKNSALLLAAAIKQANSANGTAVRNALEGLKTQILGVVTTYDKPYSRSSHEAFSEDMVVTGEVRDGRVVFAHKEEISAVIMGKRSSARR